MDNRRLFNLLKEGRHLRRRTSAEETAAKNESPKLYGFERPNGSGRNREVDIQIRAVLTRVRQPNRIGVGMNEVDAKIDKRLENSHAKKPQFIQQTIKRQQYATHAKTARPRVHRLIKSKDDQILADKGQSMPKPIIEDVAISGIGEHDCYWRGAALIFRGNSQVFKEVLSVTVHNTNNGL